MVKVVYHRDLLRLSMEGHACGGEEGHDLICASASILAETLAELVANMKKSGQTRYPTVRLSKGEALIQCTVAKRFEPVVRFAFDAICAGFELLAQSYPDNISYEIRGKI